MSDNILDDPSADFFILVNEEQQYSLWPDVLEIPPGWQLAVGPMARQQCMDWLQTHWCDLRPASLRESSAP